MLEILHNQKKTSKKRCAKELLQITNKEITDTNNLLSEREDEIQDQGCYISPSGSSGMESSSLINNSTEILNFQQNEFNNTPFRHTKVAIATVFLIIKKNFIKIY